MVQKRLLALTLLAITAQGLRTHHETESLTEKEQSESHGQEGAAKITPWKALVGLLVAGSTLHPAEAAAAGWLPSMGRAGMPRPSAGLSNGAIGKDVGVGPVPFVPPAPASVPGSSPFASRGAEPKMQESGERARGEEPGRIVPGAEVRIMNPAKGFERMRNQIGLVTSIGDPSPSSVHVRFPNGKSYYFEMDQLEWAGDRDETWWNSEEAQRMMDLEREQEQEEELERQQEQEEGEQEQPGTPPGTPQQGRKARTPYTLSDNAEYHRMRRQGLANPWLRGGRYVRPWNYQGYGMNQGYGMDYGGMYNMGGMYGYDYYGGMTNGDQEWWNPMQANRMVALEAEREQEAVYGGYGPLRGGYGYRSPWLRGGRYVRPWGNQGYGMYNRGMYGYGMNGYGMNRGSMVQRLRMNGGMYGGGMYNGGMGGYNPWQRGGRYVRSPMYGAYGMNRYNGGMYNRGGMYGYGMNNGYGMYNGGGYGYRTPYTDNAEYHRQRRESYGYGRGSGMYSYDQGQDGLGYGRMYGYDGMGLYNRGGYGY